MAVPAHPAVSANGGPVFLMIRPETIALTSAPEGGTGMVLRSTFHGHSVDYEVETTTGTLHVTDPGPDPDHLLGEGTNVTITVDPRRAYVMPGG
jgi:iron(III) transport system ATP-binding protein